MNIKTEKVIAEGKWLSLKEKIFLDNDSNAHKWESVSRQNSNGAVAIIATLKPSGDFIVIRQFRPATDKYVIEFPAGLIDKGETPEVTAIRELIEETGYTGEIISLYPQIYSSPGLTDEGVFIAFVEVNENLDINKNVQQNLEATEDIEVIIIHKNELFETLHKYIEQGDIIDAKLASFVLGTKSLL